MFDKKRKYFSPKTIDEAAELLIADLHSEHREALSRIDDRQFDALYAAVAGFILEEFKVWTGNEELLRSFMTEMNPLEIAPDPARLILQKIREKLAKEQGMVILA